MTTSSFLDAVRAALLRLEIAPDQPLVAGVSGGVDSRALLHALVQLGCRPVVAHVNYGLRGAASDEDEAFVRRLCAEAGLPLHTAHPDMAALRQGSRLSTQALARRCRYRFFERVARRAGAGAVAVAHHADDQAETVLINLFRGTGIRGLAGMAAARPLGKSGVRVVRPLLEIGRARIAAFAQEERLLWREDAANHSRKYRRSALRTEIMPLVQEIFGSGVSLALAREAALTAEVIEYVLEPRLSLLLAQCLQPAAAGVALDLNVAAAWSAAERRLVYLEAAKLHLPRAPRTSAFARRLEALTHAQTGRRASGPWGAVWRDRDRLVLLPPASEAAPGAPATLAPGLPLDAPGGVLRLDLLPEPPTDLSEGAPWTAYFDADRLELPLTVRRWAPGDRLRPLGMTGRKKISDLLTDEGLPTFRRDDALVVLSGKTIVWVPGVRMAHAPRVRPETRRVARITFAPHA